LQWRRDKQEEEECQGQSEGRMRTPGYIFVDDGSPEASDYDNNYIRYDPAERGSYEKAVEEAKRRHAATTTPAGRMRARCRESSGEAMPHGVSHSQASARRKDRIRIFWRRFLSALKRRHARARRWVGKAAGNRGAGCGCLPPRSAQISNFGLIFS
jgi:hypothetical protein